MSKSKKNTIDPQTIINQYGSDAVRLFILSDSPPEKDVQWSDEGIVSAHKFIQKFWGLHQKIIDEISKEHPKNEEDKITKYTNLFIKKITDALNNFSYNVMIAYIHELYTFLSKEIINTYTKETLSENYHKMLVAITPIIPHITNECLKQLNFNKEIKWPEFDEKLLIEEFTNIVVQINGKKRGLLKTKINSNEEVIFSLIKKEKNIYKYIGQNEIKKKIFIQNKLINIII